MLNLINLGVSMEAKCPICAEEPGSTLHALWSCSRLEVSGRCDESIVGWSYDFISDFRAANSMDTRVPILNSGNVPKWCPPGVGMFKVNTDAAVRGGQIRVDVGIVVHDHTGFILGSSIQSVFACFHSITCYKPPAIISSLPFSPLDCSCKSL
ncbi:hypothetical protein Ddye_004808 [Dipteronia dyeriana]|uniref:Reverse transcriptase zinc-binding domain-containing protein n=1 Tax=Dipteronia dyeriana TaxID=168575 RepID=A0AAD9XEY3_9ROSI|nr:hypothetical protein Ddye_004808 [Dipteronia dyeriana]